MIRRVPFTNRIEKVPLPLPIAQRHKEIQLYIDFFFINGKPFLHTKSSKINFLTAHICSSRSQGQIIRVIEEVQQIYETRGFKIVAIHGDNEFDIKTFKYGLI